VDILGGSDVNLFGFGERIVHYLGVEVDDG
jgi:hypothetical protein